MLYFVATPIGNLKEITYRAVETLKAVDVIFCEDTRHSRVLLSHYEIDKPLVSYQKFNEREKCSQIVSMLQEGKDVAVVSDAGMPVISDPGATLVKELQANGLPYTVVSGPCAAINAVVLSGQDASKFCMIGFLPDKAGERRNALSKFADLEATLIVYTPPHDVDKDLADLYAILGDRPLSVVREISKMYEQVAVGTLAQPPTFPRKGEFVLVIGGATPKSDRLSALTVEEHLVYYEKEGMSEKEAIKAVASDRKIAKSLVYAAAIQRKENKQ